MSPDNKKRKTYYLNLQTINQNDICKFSKILTYKTSDMSGQNRKDPCQTHSWRKYGEQEDKDHGS